jgi:hypothetical protein
MNNNLLDNQKTNPVFINLINKMTMNNSTIKTAGLNNFTSSFIQKIMLLTTIIIASLGFGNQVAAQCTNMVMSNGTPIWNGNEYCTGYNPSNINAPIINYTGTCLATPAYSYKWEQSIDAGAWSIISQNTPGTTVGTVPGYNPPVLTNTPSGSPQKLYQWRLIVVDSANGNQSAQSGNFSIFIASQMTATSIADLTCASPANGTINLTVNGGLSGLGYTWTASGGGSVPGAQVNNEDLSGLTPGSYTVSISDGVGVGSGGCADITHSNTIDLSNALTASITSSTNILCKDSSTGIATVTAQFGAPSGSPSYTYAWSPSGGSAATASSLPVGTYTVSVTDGASCTVTTSVTLTQPATHVVINSAIKTLYNGAELSCHNSTDGEITVTASDGTGSLQYSKDNGATYQSGSTFSGLSAGTYNIIVKDANNCTVTTNVTITAPTMVAINSASKTLYNGSDLSCYNSTDGEITITASGGTGTLQYSNDNGSNYQGGNVFSALVAGTYTLVVKDANNCTVSSVVTITAPSAVSISSATKTLYNGAELSCYNSTDGEITVSASGGTGTLQYSNDNGSTYQGGNVFSSLAAGTYSIVVKDANNCTTTVNVTITAPTAISGSASVTSNYNGAELSCAASTDGEITVIASGGTGALTYSIDGGSYGVSNVFTGLAAGPHTLSVKDANGCLFAPSTVTITAPTPITSATSSTDAFCPSFDNGTATVNPTGGTGAYAYSWSNGQTNATATALIAATYTVTVTDDNSCTHVTTVVVINSLNGPVHNINTGLNYCTIQAAINAGSTLNGHTITVDAGTYNEQVVVNKEVTIKSATATQAVVDFTGTISGKPTLFDVTANNVTIENVSFNVDLSKLRSAVIASSTGLDAITVKDNTISAYGTPAGSYGDRNAVSVNYGGSTNYRVASGGVNAVTFTNNTVTGTGAASYFRSGISLDEGGLTATGNTLTTINHDILLRFASNGVSTISNNTSNGGGIELSDQNAGSGTITLSGNTFTSAGAPGTAVLRLKNNYNGVNHQITNNTFTGFDWGVSIENMNNVTLDNNTFTGNAATDRHVVVNTKSISGNSNAIVQVPVGATITKNNFNGQGIALTLQNHDSDNDSYGSFTIGSSGNENNFAGSLTEFIRLDNQTGASTGSTYPTYAVAISSTTMDCWAQNHDIRYNQFDAGNGLELPITMDASERAVMDSKLFHKPDASCTGLLTYFYPVHNLTLNILYPTIQSAINAASSGNVIELAEWTFNETATIDKSLTLQGSTSDKTKHVIHGTGLGVTSGITVLTGITNVTIKNLTVQNFTGASGNANAGIYCIGGNNNLTIDNVASNNNPTASGIYANGPVDNVTITNSAVANNGATARGIVIWNGMKTNINITNNTVVNNNCCGIELQDGNASAVTVTGNTIDIGGGDNAIGVVGLNSSIGPNSISNNTITGGGRFGIEIKNPAGGVTVSNNNVSLTTINSELRDRAGIAVFRRGVLSGNADVPNGVTVTGNTVNGYTQSSTSEGFGIVIEGTNHVVSGNTVTNCEVGIQQQAGHLPYPADGDQSNLADQYFGRGNSPITCGNTISSNTFSSNGTDTRNVISGASYGLVTNTNTGENFCSIQAAINDAQTLNGHTITVDAGTYNEQVVVNKEVTIKSATATQAVVDFTGTVSGKPTLFDVTANNVTIENVSFNVDLSKLRSAVIASSTGLDAITVKDNTISAYGTPAGSYGDRNAVSVNYGGSTNYRVASGGVNAVTFTNNTVTGTGAASYFRSGISLDEGGLTATGNTLTTINHDILLRFASNGVSTISNNTSNGGGMELSDQNAGSGTITLSGNTFTSAGAPGTAVLRLKNNYNGVNHQITNNTFTGFDWGVSIENMNNVTLDNNTFTGNAATDRHVVVNTKSISGNSNAIVQVPVGATITKNNFNGQGIALTLQNHDSDNDSYGSFTIGSSGNENNFAGSLTEFIRLDNQTGASTGSTYPTYAVSISSTTMDCWAQNHDIRYNQFDAGNGLELPITMDASERAVMDSKLFHKPDASCTGLLTYFYPVHNVTLNILYPTIQSAINAASSGNVIELAEWTFNETATIDKSLTLQGSTSDRTKHVIHGTGLGVTSGITVLTGITNVTIKNLTVQNFTGASGNANAGIYCIGGNNNLTIDNVASNNNPTASGIYANGPVDNVTITNSAVSNNGATARGIVIWNGMKTNINITNNTVVNNNCCGIELSDGNASAVTVTGNTIDIGGGDNAIGLIGLNNTVGANLIGNNTITGGGRFGIEIKNPAGGVTVSNNNVSLTTINSELRDRAGIAVFRRSVGPGNVDVPNGVTVTGNTVNGYTQSSTSEGFGIVIEGTNHVVSGNTVTNCEVGIQQQAGHLPYPADGDQSNLADQYFGRGNSPITCGNTISSNTFSSNGVDTRNIITGASYGLVTNTNTGENFCSIQAAINDAQTLNGHTITVTSGNYPESITISKGITLNGPNANVDCSGARGAEAVITGLGGAGNAAVVISADNVSVNGFSITNPAGSLGVNSTGTSGMSLTYNLVSNVGTAISGTNVYGVLYTGSSAATSNLAITDNCISAISSSSLTGFSSGAIGILQSTSTGVVTGVAIERNMINGVTVNNGNWPTGKIAYGVILNIGGNGNYMTNTGKIVNASIKNNEISNLSGHITTGIGLEGNTENAAVENNIISNLSNTKTSALAGGGYDLNGLKFENNKFVSTCVVNNNSFQVNTFTNNGNPNLGYAVANYVPSANGGAATLGCNWYSTTVYNDIVQDDVNGKILDKVGAITNFVPYLTSGGDGAGIGFQPTGSCNGTPIIITSAVQDSITCGETAGGINIAFTDGLANHDIAWAGPTPGSATAVTSPYAITGLSAGTYTVTITDANLSTTSTVVTVIYQPVTNTTQSTYHATIQAAIDASNNGDVINVCAGTYAENLIVSKEVQILGPNATIDPCSGTRVAEAILTTAVSDIAGSGAYSIVDVQASNVVIKGFTVDGDNTSITTGFTSTTTADIDIATGITRYVTGNNLIVSNNIIKNVSYFGVELYDYPSGVPSAGNEVVNNQILDLGTYDATSGIAFWGGGVILYNNQYTKVENNCMTNVRLGIQTGNFYSANPGSSAYQSISNNTIQSRRVGIFHNLHYSAASAYTISGNTLTTLDNSNDGGWRGVLLGSLSVASTLSNNTINGTGSTRPVVEGINVWNCQIAPAITGGSISNVHLGINVNNYEGYNSDANNTTASIDGVSISNASVAGILVNDNNSNTNAATVNAEIKGNTQINNSSIGLWLNGGDASASFTGATPATFTGQTTYIDQTNNGTNAPAAFIDATAVNFDGQTGATATLAQNFAIENKINHKVDNSVLGFVRVKAAEAFVTTASGSVQRGINAASATDIVNVDAGTFNESVNANKAISLVGPNANVDCSGTRVAEAVITGLGGASNAAVAISADNVSVNGFSITNPTGSLGVNSTGTSGMSLTYNLVSNVGTAISGTNVYGVLYTGSSAATSNLAITDNCISAISSSSLTGFSSGAIGILQSTSTGVVTGVAIERNMINGVTVNNGNWPTGKIAYGVILNIGGNGNYMTNTGKIVNASIKNNEISNLSGHITTGIGLEGNTENAAVENNIISNLSNTKTSALAGGGYDLNGLKFENNKFVSTCVVNNNSFQVNTFTNNGNPNLGYAVANYVPSANGGAATLGCNWYSTTVYNDIVQDDVNGKILDKVGAATNFVPYLTSGGDGAGIGFQPTGSCNGTPIIITSALQDSITCGETSGGINIAFTDGLANHDIAWAGPTPGSTSAITSPYDITGLSAGTYTVTITDANLSTASTVVTVIYQPVTNTTQSTYHATIQAAIDASNNGDVINVCAGTFTENINITKDITLQGNNAGTDGCGTRIAESILAGGAGTAVTVSAPGATVDGFSITGASGVVSAGVNNVTITNNVMAVDAVGVNASNISTFAGGTYTINHNCIQVSSQVIAGPNPTTAGIVVAGAVGPNPVTIDDNNVSGSFYGYVLYAVSTGTPSTVTNGTITGVLQGVGIFNTLGVGFPLTASNVSVSGMNMSGFVGNHPALSAQNFHAGIYTFTAPTSTSANGIQASISNCTIDGTQSVSPASGGIYLADFSGAASMVQTILVDECTIQNNTNRGLDARGKVDVTVTESSFLENGGAAYNLGGNYGFTLIAQHGANVIANNNFVLHPATSSTQVIALLTGNGSGSNINAFDNSILMNGNATGSVANNPAGNTITATCNWLGSIVPSVNNPLANVNLIPWLIDGTDGSASAGFQPGTPCSTPCALVVDITSTNVTCNGANDGTATVNITSGGVSPYTYNWSNTSTSASISSLSPNIYSVTVTNANGCTATSSTTITEPAAITASVNSTDVTCNGANDGTITISSPMGGYGTYEYSINGGSSWEPTGNYTGLTNATYNVQIRDAAQPACVTTLNATLSITQPNALSATVNSTDVTCNGANDGTITISSPMGGYGTYEYSINGGSSWESTGNYTGLTNATYNVQIRDAAQPACVTTLNAMLSITQPNVLSATVNSTDVTCNGANDGTITISSPTGGYGTYEYSINGGSSWEPTGNYTGLTNATYNVQIRDAAQTACVISLNGSLSITQPNVLSATVNSTDVTCFNANDGTITISSPTGGYGTYEYSINGGSSWEPTGTYTGLTNATYNVQIRDAAQTACVITLNGSLAITQPNVLSATLNSTDVTCFNANDGTITISSPTGGYGTYEYSINGGSSWEPTGTYTGLTNATYNVQIRDAAQTACVITLNGALVITQPNILSATVNSTDVTCNGYNDGTITVSSPTGGYGAYEYSIDGGATWQPTGSYTGLTNTTYNVQIRDAAQTACIITLNSSLVIAQPAVVVNPTLASQSPADATLCAGTMVSATFTSGSGGTGCTEDYQLIIDGGTPVAYIPGTSVGGSATSSIVIQGRRANCLNTLCDAAYVTLATWNIVAQPTAPTTATLSPLTTTVCAGTILTLAGPATGGNAGLSCTIEYRYSDDAGATYSTPSTSIPSFTASAGVGNNIMEARRVSCQSGCSDSPWGVVATWSGVPQPGAPTTAVLSPASTTVCTGTTLTLAGAPTGGNEGISCSIQYRYSTDGGSTFSALSLTIPSFNAVLGTGKNVIQARRMNCQTGCGTSAWGTIATWDGVAQPSAPTTATASPATTSVCEGTTLTLGGAATGGDNGLSCTIEYRYSTDGGSTWSTESSTIPSFAATPGTAMNLIQARRASCQAGCTNSSWNTLATWDGTALTYAATNQTACDSYTWSVSSQTYTTSGTYTHVTGCQTDTLHLTVNYSNTGSSSHTACDMGTFGGQTYTASGTHSVTYTNASGCDSVHTYSVTINYSNTGSSNHTACDMGTFGGQTYTASGTHSVTYTNASGCDSVHTYTVTINYSNTGSSNHTACDMGTFGGQTYTASGSHSLTFTNASGCDSVHTYNVTINYSNTGSSNHTACDMGTFGGQTYTASGSHAVTYTNASGCDSVHTYNVTINYSNTGSSNHTACNMGTFGGQTYMASGSHTVTFTNASGCDSVHTYNVTINYSNTGSSNHTACDMGTFGGQTYTASGSHSVTYTNASGCDSVHTYNVTINYSNTGSSNHTACDMGTFGGQTYTASGSHAITYTNASGCDSVHTYNVTINYSNTGSSNHTACDMGTFGGQTYTASGSHSVTYTNASGCDSVHTYTVTINYSNTGSSNHTACDMGTFGGQTYTSSGSHTVTFTNASGCDSVHTYNVTINYSNTGSSNHTACDMGIFGGQTYTSSGSHTLAFTNAAGCDSIHTYNVTINYSNAGSSNHEACDMGTFGGQTYTASGSHTVSYTNAAGCDSIHTYIVTINYTPIADAPIDVTACGSYTLPSLTNGNYFTGSGGTGTALFAGGTITSTQTIYVFSPGIAPCVDAENSFLVTINPSITNPTQFETACGSYTWPQNGTTYTSTGVYTHTEMNISGCLDVYTLDLTINPLPVVTTSDVYACVGTQVTLPGSPAGGFWDLPNPYTASSGTIAFNYIYIDVNGCVGTASASVIGSQSPLVSNVQVISITGISASVTYNPIPGIAFYELRWRPTTPANSTWIVGTNSNFTTKVLISLIPNTEYEVQIRSFCSVSATTVWSPSTIFNTNSSCGVPTGLFVTNITATSAKLNWTAATGPVSHYNVRFKKTSTSTWTVSSASTNTKTIVGLTAGTYEFQVQTVCGNSIGAWSPSGPTFVIGGGSKSNAIEEEVVEAGNMKIYPNPTSGQLNVEYSSDETSLVNLKVADMSGRIVKQVQAIVQKGINQLEIDLSDLANGIYNLQVIEHDQLIHVTRITKRD